LLLVIIDNFNLEGTILVLSVYFICHDCFLHDFDILGIPGHQSILLFIKASDKLSELIVEHLNLSLCLIQLRCTIDRVHISELVELLALLEDCKLIQNLCGISVLFVGLRGNCKSLAKGSLQRGELGVGCEVEGSHKIMIIRGDRLISYPEKLALRLTERAKVCLGGFGFDCRH
jgi:hypothetical protein